MASFCDIESYTCNIEELIFDEKKILTYSLLSKSLGIPSNLSKQLLYKFLENNPRILELCVTYLLIGLPKHEKTYKVLVVKDKDLKKVENSFKSITSKHIYSIHKSLEYSDVNVLYAAQQEECNDSILKGISAIDFNMREKNGAVLVKFKVNALPEISKQATEVLKKVSAEDYADLCCKGSIPVNNKGTQDISTFFNKPTIKLNNIPKNVTIGEKCKESTTVSDVLESLSPLEQNKAALSICNGNTDYLKNIQTLKEASLKNEATLKSMKSDPKLNSAPEKVNGKYNKKGQTKSNKKQEKKRKRLVLLSDSESNNTTEDEDEVKRQPTPEPQATMTADYYENNDIISGTPEPSRKRKKKLISKSFISEDGYVITEKQYIEASFSEGEETSSEKKFKESTSQDNNLANIEDNITKTHVEDSFQLKKESTKSNIPSTHTKKQASLTSFFKKK